MDNELINNLDKIHSTELGIKRIKKNQNINPDNVIECCREKIENSDSISRNGKNWYAHVGDCIFTVNSHSFTIITALLRHFLTAGVGGQNVHQPNPLKLHGFEREVVWNITTMSKRWILMI